MARIWMSGGESQDTSAGGEFTGSTTSPTVETTIIHPGGGKASVKEVATSGSVGTNIYADLYGSDNTTEHFIRGYLYIATLPNTITALTGGNTDVTILGVSNAGGFWCEVTLDGSGVIRVYEDGTSRTLLGTSQALEVNQWHMIELGYCSTTTYVEARVNGLSIGSTNAAAGIGGFYEVAFGIAQATGEHCNGTIYWDDMAVNDSTGSVNNSWPGQGAIINLLPSGTGDVNTFGTQTGGTAGGGNNFTRVNEITPDDATTFNGDNTVNHEDLFAVQGSRLNGTVSAVQVHGRFRNNTADAVTAVKFEIEKTGSGTIKQSAAIIPNNTGWFTDATARGFTPAITAETDPDGATWTNSTLNSMQIGYKITAGGTNRIDVTKVWAVVEHVPPSPISLEMDIKPYSEYLQTDVLIPKAEVQNTNTALANGMSAMGENTYYDPNEPIGYRGSAFVYDTRRKRYIMTFGANGATSQNGVYELKFINGRAKWRQLAPTGTAPLVRYQGGGVYDAVNDRMITVFGFTTVDTNELWSLSFAKSAEGVWSQLTTFTGSAPLARSNVTQTVMNDPVNQCFYVFGGWGASFYNGIYKFVYTTIAGAWTNLSADGAAGNAPTARRNANAILDTQNNRIIVTFGNINTTTGTQNDLHAFALSGNTWSVLSPTGGPPSVRERAWSYYDPIQKCGVFAMGDNDNTAAPIQDMWKLDTTTTNCTWTEIDRAQDNTGYMVTGMYLCNAQWNPDMVCGIIWAGGVDITADLQHHVLVIDSNDMGNSRVDIYGAMYNHFMRPMDATSAVYNTDFSESVTVGGFSQMTDNTTPANGGHITDIFVYNYTSNVWRVATKGFKTFPHREGVMAVYDSVGQRVIAFGGLWGAGATNKGTFADTWEIKRDVNGNYGVRRMAPTGTPPGARWLGAAAFDSVNNRVLITMGSNGGTSNFNDTLALGLSSGDGAWTTLTPTGSPPTAAWGVAYANDTNNKILYVFGGATSALDTTYVNTFSKLDYSTTNCAWTALSSTSALTARRSANIAVDHTNNKVIAFGGYNGTIVEQDLDYYDITGNTWGGAATPGTSPGARRSHGGWYDPNNSRYMITHGRTVASAWWGDTWQLTPNYGTPASSTWANRSPAHYIRGVVQPYSLHNNSTYHWQGWLRDNTFSAETSKTAYGSGNAETATDFIIGQIVLGWLNIQPQPPMVLPPNIVEV